MSGALLHGASFPVGENNHLKNGTGGQVKRMVKMMACSPIRMRTFSGLRSSNALDNIMRTGHDDIHSNVALATSVRKLKVGSRIVPKAMFERFTEKGKKVIMLAQEESRRLGHNFVGTEQIFLGLIGEGSGIAFKVLMSMGFNLKDARVEVEKVIGRGSGFVVVDIPFTPRSKRVLELSVEEARKLGHNYIGTEHLLLALLREGEGVAARVVEYFGADPSNIRTQVIQMVGESAETVGAVSQHYEMEKLLQYKRVGVHEGGDAPYYRRDIKDALPNQRAGEEQAGKQVMPMPKSTRSCTKVQKQGIAFGRALDLTKFKNYDELVAELDDLFEFHGELKNRNKNWLIVYTDIEGDMMLVGDDPWQEFCGLVCKIFIYTRAKVQRMNRGTLSSRGEEVSSVAQGMNN